ncbi:hypothetical protein DM02DRAFT_129533 [Periconia macrospinosa]|uniref:Secreted protein n=1 Tax=Periconia macrospinosa TaxID=97972 RepID=A0A2V1DDT2_9PLEO|nr:hypothetical protein DM02DRAFT_129533 [Periconia macrospinosa]
MMRISLGLRFFFFFFWKIHCTRQHNRAILALPLQLVLDMVSLIAAHVPTARNCSFVCRTIAWCMVDRRFKSGLRPGCQLLPRGGARQH